MKYLVSKVRVFSIGNLVNFFHGAKSAICQDLLNERIIIKIYKIAKFPFFWTYLCFEIDFVLCECFSVFQQVELKASLKYGVDKQTCRIGKLPLKFTNSLQ